jgi:ParB/RepB/Spo0J family partition protein
MAELVDSVKLVGVLQPLLVRPIARDPKIEKGPLFEIVCGSRRFRAAQEAGLKAVPCHVQDIPDDLVLELMIVENLHREDIRPMEEAEGFRQLMATGRYTIEDLSAKVGKAARYVHRRMKLCDLIEEARKVFDEGRLTLGMAELVARLLPPDQKKALRYLQSYTTIVSLRQWISDNTMRDLKRSPFDVKAAELLPKTGACADCRKRTGAHPTLYDEIEGGADLCTDPRCYARKTKAGIEATLAENAAADKPLVPISRRWATPTRGVPEGTLGQSAYTLLDPKDKPCPDTKAALVVQEDNYPDRAPVGSSQRICTKKTCKQHGRPHSGPYQRTTKEQAEYDRDERDRRTDARVNDLRRVAVLDAVKWPPSAELIALLASAMAVEMLYESPEKAEYHGLELPEQFTGSPDEAKALLAQMNKLKPRELLRLLVDFTALVQGWGHNVSGDFAALYGVDEKALKAQAAKEVSAEWKAAKQAKAEPEEQPEEEAEA